MTCMDESLFTLAGQHALPAAIFQTGHEAAGPGVVTTRWMYFRMDPRAFMTMGILKVRGGQGGGEGGGRVGERTQGEGRGGGRADGGGCVLKEGQGGGGGRWGRILAVGKGAGGLFQLRQGGRALAPDGISREARGGVARMLVFSIQE